MADEPAIVQLFDWRFRDVARVLPRLGRLGYTHVHVSPPQQSNEAVWQWWGRYQPRSFTQIGGPLGSEADFAHMTGEARRAGLAIVADVVAADPSGPPDHIFGHALADQEGAWTAGFAYLDRLARLGVRGFRFDGAQRLPPAFFAQALPRFPGLLSFGEIVEHDPARLAPYLAVRDLRLYDFPMLAGLRAAFAPGGDLRRQNARQALPRTRGIAFVRNHDIERGQANDRGIDEPGYRHRYGVGWDEKAGRLDRKLVDLAQAFVFARAGTVPYVLSGMATLTDGIPADRFDSAAITAALRFRNLCGTRPEIPLIRMRDLIAWQRGEDRLVVINKAARTLRMPPFRAWLRPGRYRDLVSGRWTVVPPDGRLTGLAVRPRSASFYVR